MKERFWEAKRVAKGKKTSPEMIEKIMESYKKTGSFSETARELGKPVGTVHKIVNENISDSESFARKATELIDMGMEFLDMRFRRALDTERAILKGQCDPESAKSLPKLSEITSAIGALYDKRSAASPDREVQEDINIKIHVI